MPHAKQYGTDRYVHAKVCEYCGKEFHAKFGRSESNRWCSRECFHASKRRTMVCEQCGNKFYVLKSTLVPRRFCSRPCFRQERRQVLERKRHITGRGYVYVYAPDHPSVRGKNYNYVAEHRLVMEGILGRYLNPWENVHHKDTDRQNNEPDNLEFWTVNQPAGQANVYLNEIVQLKREIAALKAINT